MQQEQIKALLVNIFTGAVIVGVFVAGYFVLVKKDTEVVTSVASVARIAEQTASIGVEIDATLKDLRELTDAVSRSKVFFDMPEFRNLENFTVTVPREEIGRDNPFVPTVWKTKMKALEEAAGKSTATQASTQSASASETQPSSAQAPATPASALEGLLGDFDTGL